MVPSRPVHVCVVFSHERTVADFLKRVLDSAGFATFAAPPDLAALEGFVQAIEPHAVVVDLPSYDEAGWRALARLRSRSVCRDVPMVITTDAATDRPASLVGPALSSPAIVEMFTRADDLRELRAAVHAAIRGAHARRADAPAALVPAYAARR